MATLEEAGIVYDPWTTTNIWGQPSPVQVGPVQVGYGSQDNSAYPELTGQQFARPDVHQGSSRGPQFQERTARKEVQQQNQFTSLLFVAVLSAALLWRRM